MAILPMETALPSQHRPAVLQPWLPAALCLWPNSAASSWKHHFSSGQIPRAQALFTPDTVSAAINLWTHTCSLVPCFGFQSSNGWEPSTATSRSPTPQSFSLPIHHWLSTATSKTFVSTLQREAAVSRTFKQFLKIT